MSAPCPGCGTAEPPAPRLWIERVPGKSRMQYVEHLTCPECRYFERPKRRRRQKATPADEGGCELPPKDASSLRCHWCGAQPYVVGIFVPDAQAIRLRLLYAMCDRCYPPTAPMLLELEQKFFADPRIASCALVGGRA